MKERHYHGQQQDPSGGFGHSKSREAPPRAGVHCRVVGNLDLGLDLKMKVCQLTQFSSKEVRAMFAGNLPNHSAADKPKRKDMKADVELDCALKKITEHRL